MANILAIDSSTEACSVALTYSDKVFERHQLAPRKHAELLLPMVDEVLAQAQIELTNLDAIACCVGPGAFTGLRIAISVAQGLAYASNLPCIAVSSLEALAYESFSKSDSGLCLASIDARMQEVYFEAFKRGGNSLPISISSAEVASSTKITFSLSNYIEQHDVDLPEVKICRAGTGWREYRYQEEIEQLEFYSVDVVSPKAKYMLSLAQQRFQLNELLKPELLQPVYLRNNVAKKKAEQK